MSSRSDQYADEAHRDEGEPGEYADRAYADRPHGGGPSAGERGHRRFPHLPSLGWGMLPWTSRERERDDYVDRPAESTEYRPAEEAETDGGGIASYWDEGLIALFIVGGAILFVFPEPVTSGIGVLLVTVGVLAWLVDQAT